MLKKKTQQPQNRVLSNKSTESTSALQHGLLLLHIPPESLTHITSNLDPKSLLVLGQVNTHLYRHIKDDHTWHRAFVCQYLGIGPETHLHNAKCLLLRRSQPGSWRQEYILYFSLRRRWERSRNTTTAHIPLHSAVSSMHLMPSHGLICSSLQYGVVSRSLPLTGRILRGYLDAAGSGTGLGIGNPNTEFTPNVSSCALGSDGGIAKIVWGFRNGEVAFTAANKAMDASSRSAAKFSKCTVGDQHQGAVHHVIWDAAYALTGGGDGRAKIWDPKRARCIWASDARFQDECVKLAAALNQGIVAGAMRSGNIVVWSGFASDMPDGPASVAVLTLPCPVEDDANHEISSLHVDSCGPSPALLVTFSDSIFFYRFNLNLTTGTFEAFRFGDAALGAVTSLTPFFSNQPGEYSLIIAGTQLGCVGIYDWASTDHRSLPTYKFEVSEDGAAVTALAWNGLTLVTGCARGTTKVFDALTLERLRTFLSPLPRRRPATMLGGPVVDPAVRQILLGPEKEVLVVAVGDHIMAWRAGPVPKGGFKNHAAGKKKAARAGAPAKSYQQIEMRQALVESRHLLDDESRYRQKAYGREREQRAQLDTLGLDEVEAVEYVLMLSREEAVERERERNAVIDEGVFEGDFDEDDNAGDRAVLQGRRGSVSSSSSGSSVPSSASASGPSSPARVSASMSPVTSTPIRNGRPIPHPSPSNAKIQVSPPFRAEPTEALFTPSPPHARPAADAHFPPISVSASTSGSASTSTSPKGSAAASPAKRSAWSMPLARSPAADSPSPGTSISATRGHVSPSPKTQVPSDDEMDDDLRFAIALSLAEAESLAMQKQ